MSDLINGRTPEEIKKGLRHCQTVCLEDCPYYRTGIKCSECTTHLSQDALAYIQYLEAKQPRWISVKERLPEGAEDERPCLVYMAVYDECIIADYAGDGEWLDRADLTNVTRLVTHWMPLPKQPEEEG